MGVGVVILELRKVVAVDARALERQAMDDRDWQRIRPAVATQMQRRSTMKVTLNSPSDSSIELLKTYFATDGSCVTSIQQRANAISMQGQSFILLVNDLPSNQRGRKWRLVTFFDTSLMPMDGNAIR
jgi:hypothetical protein